VSKAFETTVTRSDQVTKPESSLLQDSFAEYIFSDLA